MTSPKRPSSPVYSGYNPSATPVKSTPSFAAWRKTWCEAQPARPRGAAGFNAFKDDISVFRGLDHPTRVGVGGHCSADSFLTGTAHTAAVKGPSLDQVAAAEHGHKTRYPSLVLGNEGGIGGSGTSTTLSYDRFGFPIASLSDIREIYNALFNADPDQRGRQKGDIQRMERWIDTPKPEVDADTLSLAATVSEPGTFIRTMYDLIYLAFKTDSTRYATYMLMSMSSRTLGLGSTHHGMAHKPTDKLGEFDKFQSDLIVELVQKLIQETNQARNTRNGCSSSPIPSPHSLHETVDTKRPRECEAWSAHPEKRGMGHRRKTVLISFCGGRCVCACGACASPFFSGVSS